MGQNADVLKDPPIQEWNDAQEGAEAVVENPWYSPPRAPPPQTMGFIYPKLDMTKAQWVEPYHPWQGFRDEESLKRSPPTTPVKIIRPRNLGASAKKLDKA